MVITSSMRSCAPPSPHSREQADDEQERDGTGKQVHEPVPVVHLPSPAACHALTPSPRRS